MCYLRLFVVWVCLFSLLGLSGCGGDSKQSNSIPAVAATTVLWQPDTTGALQFLTNDQQYYGWTFWHWFTDSYEAQMTTVSARVRKVSGAAGTGYGIIFCYQDNDNFYRLLIHTGGRYMIQKKVQGVYSSIYPWTTPLSAHLNTGYNANNVITVTQDSVHNFSVSFNGVLEAVFDDSSFSGGMAGLTSSVSSTNDFFPVIPADTRFQLLAPVVHPVTAAGKATTTPAGPAEADGFGASIGVDALPEE